MADRIFIYGTLHPDRAPREISHAASTLLPVGRGTVRGHLYDFGEYPGLVLDATAEQVAGEVFTVPNPAVLRELDAYEEFQPEKPSKSLFVRKKTTVSLENGETLRCWIYVYNRLKRNRTPQATLAAVA